MTCRRPNIYITPNSPSGKESLLEVERSLAKIVIKIFEKRVWGMQDPCTFSSFTQWFRKMHGLNFYENTKIHILKIERAWLLSYYYSNE